MLMDTEDRGPGFSLRKTEGEGENATTSEEAFYPLHLDVDLASDPQLVKLVTDTPYARWADELDKVLEADPDDPDPSIDEMLAHVGLLAIALKRANPRWPAGKIKDFISKRGLDFEFVNGAAEDDGLVVDADPPAEAGDPPAPNAISETSAETSNVTQVFSWGNTQQKPSGVPGSETTADSAQAI